MSTTPNCSFCGKAASEVRHIIVGPDCGVCDECLELLTAIMAEENPGWRYEQIRALQGFRIAGTPVGLQKPISLEDLVHQIRDMEPGAVVYLTYEDVAEMFPPTGMTDDDTKTKFLALAAECLCDVRDIPDYRGVTLSKR